MTLDEKVDKLIEDVSFIKGKLEQQQSSNKDWISRIGLGFCILWALFKSKLGGA